MIIIMMMTNCCDNNKTEKYPLYLHCEEKEEEEMV